MKHQQTNTNEYDHIAAILNDKTFNTDLWTTGYCFETWVSMIDGDKRDDSIMQFLTTDRHVHPIDAHMQAIQQSASVELSMIDGDRRDYKHMLSLMVGSGFESISSVPSILSHTAT